MLGEIIAMIVGGVATSAIKEELGLVTTELKKLVKGFGGDPGATGQYITEFAGKVPKDVGIKNNAWD